MSESLEFAGKPPTGTGAIDPPRRWLVIGLSVAILAAAVAAISVRGPEPGEATLFRYAFAAGESRTYEVVMTMNMSPTGMPGGMPPMETTFTSRMTHTVAEVRDDGTTVLDITMSDIQMSGLPTGDGLTEEGSMRMTVAPDGRVTSIEGDGQMFSMPALPGPLGAGSPTDSAAPQMFFPQYPDRAIAPGDTWTQTHEVPLGIGEQTMSVTVNGRHDGYEDTPFGRAARIHTRSEIPMDMEIPMGEILGQFTEGTPGMGAPGMQPPPGLAQATMTIRGSTAMDATSLVLPDTSDMTSTDGIMTMEMHIEMPGFPAMDGQTPEGYGMTVTMNMQVTRVA